MPDLLMEKLERLREREMALIVERGGEILFESPESRVVALVSVLRDRPEVMRGSTVTDKVVGAAAAKLCVYGGAAAVFAGVASDAAWDALGAAGVPLAAGDTVPVILNQDRTDMCPMERMSRDISEPAELFRTIMARMAAAAKGDSR